MDGVDDYSMHLKEDLKKKSKRIVGIKKCSHHSNLLKALKIPLVEDVIIKNSLCLYKKYLQNKYPCKRPTVSTAS